MYESKILLIKSVFLRDCIKNDVIEEPEEPEPVITSLPSVFYGLDSWLTSTSIPCDQCKKTFDTIPVFIPTSIQGSIMKTSGCYCSFNCMNSYNKNNNKNICEYITIRDRINYLHELFPSGS